MARDRRRHKPDRRAVGTGEQCYEDQLYYYVWYEMFPAGTVQEGTQACINNNVDCPRPGDQISASVNVTPGTGGNNNYTLALTDYTTSGTTSRYLATCATNPCLDQSAEWIMERPAFEVLFGAQFLPTSRFQPRRLRQRDRDLQWQNHEHRRLPGWPCLLHTDARRQPLVLPSCLKQVGRLASCCLSPRPTPARPPRLRVGGNFNVTWDSSF